MVGSALIINKLYQDLNPRNISHKIYQFAIASNFTRDFGKEILHDHQIREFDPRKICPHDAASRLSINETPAMFHRRESRVPLAEASPLIFRGNARSLNRIREVRELLNQPNIYASADIFPYRSPRR